MSSIKISAIANAKELLKTQTAVKNELNSTEIKDPVTKISYPLRTFVQMVNFYIPTGAELNGGGIDKRIEKLTISLELLNSLLKPQDSQKANTRITRNGATNATTSSKYL